MYMLSSKITKKKCHEELKNVYKSEVSKLFMVRSIFENVKIIYSHIKPMTFFSFID